MKAGFYVWIDYKFRKVRISKDYEMVEEFDARYNNQPYPHKWGVEIFEFQTFAEAKNAQIEIANTLKKNRVKELGTNFTDRESLVSLYEHCKEESGLTNDADIRRYMNRHYGLN
jgi:hypothetical protein